MYVKLRIRPDWHQDRISQTIEARQILQDLCDENGIDLEQVNLYGVGTSLPSGRSEYGGRSFMDIVKTIFSIWFVVIIGFKIMEIVMGGA